MAKKTKTNDELLDAIRKYEELAADICPIEKEKKAQWATIQRLMGETEEKVVPGFGLVTYKHDKDREVVTVDPSFAEEQPKLYKKYVKVEFKQGARRLVLKGMNEE